MVEKLAYAVYNDVVQGLKGISANPTISIEQLKDDIIDERLIIIKEYSLKNIIPVRDLVMSVNCIRTDCESLDKCPHSNCNSGTRESYSKPQIHFEIPQIVNDFGEKAIQYIGSVDRSVEFKVYFGINFSLHKYRRRGADKPYVYISTSPNENNMYDC